MLFGSLLGTHSPSFHLNPFTKAFEANYLEDLMKLTVTLLSDYYV